MLIRDPSGEGQPIWIDDDLAQQYAREKKSLYEARCRHERREVRIKTKQNQSKVAKAQCLNCGEPLGQESKRSDHPNAPDWDEALNATYLADRKASENELEMRYYQLSITADTSGEDDYYHSEAWREKREKVKRRANRICEGCLEKRAVHVHHLTYDNFGDELLFQLVALCTSCHSKLHPKKISPNHRVDAIDMESLPCPGCRWQGGEEFCGRFNVSCAEALSPRGPCGSTQQGFQGLR